METLIVFMMCAMYFGILAIPVVLAVLVFMWMLNMYCKEKFGEGLFNFKTKDKA